MSRIAAVLMMLLIATAAYGRSLSYALKSAESGSTGKAEYPAAAPNLILFRGASTKDRRPTDLPLSHAGAGRKPAYDITRETGAYFFDTVYKFRMPATRRLHIGLNGGYTFYDRYMHGFGKGGGSLGLVGGVTLTFLRPGKPGAPLKKSFLRLNADVISYPYRYKAGAKDAYDLSRYTRDLSARVYFDARITRRALTTRCMMGVVASGSEQQAAALPLFVGIAVCYRLP